MAAFINLIIRWQTDLWVVLSKPVILFSMIVIGFFMSMFALQQVHLVFWYFGYYQNQNKYLQWYPSLLRVAMVVGFLWLDLLVLKHALVIFNTCPQLEDQEHSEEQNGSISQTEIRRNPVRTCRVQK